VAEFVAVEYWSCDAETFGDAYTLYDEGAFAAGGFVDMFVRGDNGDLIDVEGRRFRLMPVEEGS